MAKYLFVLTLICISVTAHADEKLSPASDGALAFQFGNVDTPVDRSLFYFPISRSLGIKVDLDAKAEPFHPPTDPASLQFFFRLRGYQLSRR